MAGIMDLASLAPTDTVLKLPHPYLTEYTVQRGDDDDDKVFFQLLPKEGSTVQPLPFALHAPHVRFSAPADLKSSELPASANNSLWARSRRSPFSDMRWEGETAPTLAQTWLLLYVLFTVRPGMELVRLQLSGRGADVLSRQLREVLLGIAHPPPPKGQAAAPEEQAATETSSTVVVLRSTFWQGAGSPFGPRPVWCPDASPSSLPASTPLSQFPATPLQHTITVASAGDPQDPERYQQSLHPIRPAKPAPGAVIYSRWVPHLKETFSMISLDYTDAEHLRLFHEWQNDPRVSQGWNETGTLEQHREYLRKIHEDPHQVALLAKWDDAYFAYFEIYWAKEDRLGGYYDAQDYDRGRHSLVGDVKFRGPHRVTAWWSSLMHYLFLDDPRTMWVVGEPKDTNAIPVMYDLIHGFGLERFVDLPHKRSALVRCPRVRFFQLCPLGAQEKAVGGVNIGLVPKL
ncbi:Siderophore biosynthesis protein [Beauveria brongniartii RCEF 3172]|uniref:Siderophore biosynthesis protein n=1 Tax=Beauveria brongniartii RCEF 3172 TaxID=1081107 RepID=A0A162JQ85_9HYPO|nr:Siderophore biosynthesis protein [Beauveria brongniartii RCEF 3172]